VKDDTSTKPFNQEELNDLIKELGLPKHGLLASTLKERNMLTKGTKISCYRNRDEPFRKCFTEEDDFVYCNDVTGVMNELKQNVYKSEEWRLFIDSSNEALKQYYCITQINMFQYL